MDIAAERTIREIALEHPATVRVFERFGIDYCCGGDKPLAQACHELQLSFDQVTEKLEAATGAADEDDIGQWRSAALSKVIQHIVRRHHTFVRQEIPRLRALAKKALDKHGAAHPELAEVKELLGRIREELTAHLLKEERVVFPYIAHMEYEVGTGRGLSPAVFGGIAKPLEIMLVEHDTTSELLASIRKITKNFEAPQGACSSYHELFSGMRKFEADMHRHIHLENNVLFPRAVQLEKENTGTAR